MKVYYSLFFLTVLCLIATAQPPPPPATPIDGGLGLLLAGGLALGAKKLLKKKH